MRNFNFIDLFAGIGGMRIPFEKLGGTCVFIPSGINTPKKLMLIILAKRLLVTTKIDDADIPTHDFLLAGFPCQPFRLLETNLVLKTQGVLYFLIS